MRGAVPQDSEVSGGRTGRPGRRPSAGTQVSTVGPRGDRVGRSPQGLRDTGRRGPAGAPPGRGARAQGVTAGGERRATDLKVHETDPATLRLDHPCAPSPVSIEAEALHPTLEAGRSQFSDFQMLLSCSLSRAFIQREN